eukprot:scaffold60977_cov69-Phaeocystis_antarctica.AAC.3
MALLTMALPTMALLTTHRLDSERRAARGVERGAHDLGRHLELHALLLEHPSVVSRPTRTDYWLPVEGGGDLRVEAGRDVVEELHHGHLRAQPAPDGAHLEADDAWVRVRVR